MAYETVKALASETVLCWLATLDEEGWPNVSPKEIFCFHGSNLIIANIASPRSEKNILANGQVCVSFLEVYKQKGFKLKAVAKIVMPQDDGYTDKLALLRQKAPEQFPIKNIFDLKIVSAKPILAPSYGLFNATEGQQIAAAEQQYKEVLARVKNTLAERTRDAR